MTKIGNYMFSGCSGLTSVTIPACVTHIGSSAFRSCSSLTNVAIPNSITSIEPSTFYDCNGLTSVTIPDSGSNAFYNCCSMEAFSVSGGNPAYKAVSGLLLTKDGKTLLCGVNGDVRIPDGVTDLSTYAFLNCSELTSIVIPESVLCLPTTAFDGCNKLWTSWYRTLANLSVGGASSGGSSSSGSSGGNSKTVSLSVTNIIVHYVTQSLPSTAVTPNTNSTGIVNIIAEVTVSGNAIAISQDWAAQYPDFAATFGTDFSAALTMETGKYDGAGKPVFVWQDYVAGTDPTDPNSVFTASVTFDAETGEPVISWSPELSPAEAAKRLYRIYGKVQMTDPDWLPLDGYLSGYNFYRVTVEMK